MRYGLVALLLISSFSLAFCAEQNLDRTLEKLAALLVRECPELRGEMRVNEARQAMLKEFELLKVDKITKSHFKELSRGGVRYESHFWKKTVAQFEQAHFEQAKLQCLLRRAKSEKMTREEAYVVEQLLNIYYEQELEKREERVHRQLREVGKAFTAYTRHYRRDPELLAQFVPDLEQRRVQDPLTGEWFEWVYVEPGSVELRGANKYRVVAYAPFPSGRRLAYTMVAYKGGKVGSWKTDALVKAIEQRDADMIARQKELDGKALAKKESSEAKVKKHKKLKLSIKELW